MRVEENWMEDEVRNKTRQKYQRLFHVFQSKAINSILTNTKTQTSIAFNDLRFDGDDIEYLKRFYMANESLVRIVKLINYYECNMTSPHPNFVPLPASQVMGTRHRKLLRLQAQREQSLARRREGEPIKEVLSGEPSEKQNILQHLSNQNLSDLQNMDDDVEMESFDSEVHDIYYGNTMESRFRFAYSSNGPEESVLDVKKIKESDLIIDFRATNRSNQANKNREDIQNSQRAKPDLDTQKSPYLSIVSPDQKVQKKKSFIGYYNSLQKKQPSRILQRYMKEKK